jgi:hypothetical protein
MIAFFLAVVLILSSFIILFDSSILTERIEQNLTGMTQKNYATSLFSQRLAFWSVSAEMMKEYPVSGVGLGAYIIELPGYLKRKGLLYRHTDSAENYFCHLGSELGLVGLLFSLWLVYEIFRVIQMGMRDLTQSGKDKYLFIGVVSGIFAIFINLMFHSYVGSFELKYLLWFLIAVVCIYASQQGDPRAKRKRRKWLIPLGMLLMFAFGGFHIWNSLHSLSIKGRAKEYGWNQNFGTYTQEQDEKGEFFFWTHRIAGFEIDHLGGSLVIPARAAHPKIDEYPVTVRIFAANEYFNKKDLIVEQELSHNGWIEIDLQTNAIFKNKLRYVLETSYDWQPSQHSNSPDHRRLGIAMRRPWFRYAEKRDYEDIYTVQKYSLVNWQGELKDKLWSNGKSHMEIKVEEGGGYLCFNLKGERAYGIGPFLVMRLDGEIIGETMLTEEGWVSLVFENELGIGKHDVSIEYINNYGNAKSGDDREDRNVYLGDVEIIRRRH